jgi:hypothetical protein
MRRASESEFLVYGSKTTNHIIEMYSRSMRRCPTMRSQGSHRQVLLPFWEAIRTPPLNSECEKQRCGGEVGMLRGQTAESSSTLKFSLQSNVRSAWYIAFSSALWCRCVSFQASGMFLSYQMS